VITQFDTILTPRNPVTGWWGNVASNTSASLVVTPTISASLVTPPKVANANLTVDPNIVAALNKHAQASAHLTVTPTFHAVLEQPGTLNAHLSVTPTLHATATRGVSDSGALTVHPTISAALLKGVRAAAALTVTPTFSASATVSAPATPTFDKVATGMATTGSSFAWSDSATAGTTVLALVVVTNSANTISSVKYGASGPTMTLVGSVPLDNVAADGTLALFELASAPGATTSIVVTLSASSTVSGCSISYSGVSSIGTPTTAFGDPGAAGTLSQALTCSSGQIILQAFGSLGLATTTTTGGGTARAKLSRLVIQDSTASTTFTATTDAAQPFGALGVVLL
jgi:hypothetical protein